ncbi:hypothetical protein [uncultured Bacteroides sp.]|uniref:hypothetical protein n=1 Tax=uncultured Bacteroides sp. TaxID=162156 RepID=UPI002AABC667|nr:hypothetical protein [uncultured Bacteroides sp.]
MDFLKTIENQSENLKKAVLEKKDFSFLTVANDGEHILCEGAGNPNKIAHSILNVLERDKSLQLALKEEIEADRERKIGVKLMVVKANNVEDIKKAIDEIKASL